MEIDETKLTTYLKTIELWWLFRQVSNLINKAIETELWQLGGVSYHHSKILYIVKAIEATGGKATPSEISRWLVLEPHTISTLLVRMEKGGLIRKTRDLERKNLVRVSVTDKGEDALGIAAMAQTFTNVLAGLSDKEKDCLEELLYKMRSNAIGELLKTMPRKRPEDIAAKPQILK